ncbi:MAG: LLM class flavin-dependent oxidoreductase, partial [Spirochaetaceae bacterium]|nr:LLM class flavin-dependent oxidoreductase [Spirochaetaceae bacterium]
MKFGWILPNNWGVARPADVIDLGVRAEALGYNSVWVNHHVLNVGYVEERLGNRPYYDALTTLTWIAARTERLRLGT